jgi:hypothetical protein
METASTNEAHLPEGDSAITVPRAPEDVRDHNIGHQLADRGEEAWDNRADSAVLQGHAYQTGKEPELNLCASDQHQSSELLMEQLELGPRALSSKAPASSEPAHFVGGVLSRTEAGDAPADHDMFSLIGDDVMVEGLDGSELEFDEDPESNEEGRHEAKKRKQPEFDLKQLQALQAGTLQQHAQLSERQKKSSHSGPQQREPPKQLQQAPQTVEQRSSQQVLDVQSSGRPHLLQVADHSAPPTPFSAMQPHAESPRLERQRHQMHQYQEQQTNQQVIHHQQIQQDQTDQMQEYQEQQAQQLQQLGYRRSQLQEFSQQPVTYQETGGKGGGVIAKLAILVSLTKFSLARSHHNCSINYCY